MNKVTDIKIITLNGRKIKIFSAWERSGNAWVFAGRYSAPHKTANKNLIAEFLEVER
jgi:hypothetical protein